MFFFPDVGSRYFGSLNVFLQLSMALHTVGRAELWPFRNIAAMLFDRLSPAYGPFLPSQFWLCVLEPSTKQPPTHLRHCLTPTVLW